MAGPLSSPQGLRVVTDGRVDYDDVHETLTRRTRIVAVNGDGDPIWPIIQAVMRVGLKVGLNLQSRHELETDGGQALLRWAVVNEGAPFPTTLSPLYEDRSMSQDLKRIFDIDGKWFGFNIPAQASPPQHPVLCFELRARRFKVKGAWSVYPVHIVAVEAVSSFDDHFVLGFSGFTKGRNNASVDFASTVIAIP